MWPTTPFAPERMRPSAYQYYPASCPRYLPSDQQDTTHGSHKRICVCCEKIWTQLKVVDNQVMISLEVDVSVYLVTHIRRQYLNRPLTAMTSIWVDVPCRSVDNEVTNRCLNNVPPVTIIVTVRKAVFPHHMFKQVVIRGHVGIQLIGSLVFLCIGSLRVPIFALLRCSSFWVRISQLMLVSVRSEIGRQAC